MDYSEERDPVSRITFHASRFVSPVLWTVTALVVCALVLRFAMRAVGVRGDVPFPAFVYGLTAPLVEPFYRFFPVSERFDFKAVEAASLVAAGVVLACALGVYTLGLLLTTRGK
jgi:uncharacterized protein YggT (Ycf19 family)